VGEGEEVQEHVGAIECASGAAHGFYLRNGYEHYKTQKAFRKGLES